MFSKDHLVMWELQKTLVSSQRCQPQDVSLSSEFIVVICHINWFQGFISTITKRPWRNVLNLIVSIILCVCVTYCRAYIFYRLLIENNFLFSDPRGMSGVVYSRVCNIYHFNSPFSFSNYNSSLYNIPRGDYYTRGYFWQSIKYSYCIVSKYS